MLRRIVLYLCFSCLLLPIIIFAVCYGLLCSEHFVLKYLLPYISEATGTTITATRASVSPFTQVSLGGVKVYCDQSKHHCSSTTQLSLSATSIDVTYDLWNILSRRVAITSLHGDEVHVMFTHSPDTTSNTQPPEPLPNAAPRTPHSPSPSLTLSVTNASLTNSSFNYIDKPTNATYTFGAITIEVPFANSHGDAAISLSTQVTISSKSLRLQDETLSGSLSLIDNSFFAPRLVTLNARAGSATPAALEVLGKLEFAAAPYQLSTISVTKATVRDSLLTALGIQHEMFSNFELALQGEHSLSTPKPTHAQIQIRKAILPSSYNLAGTTVRSALTLKERSIDVKDSELNLIINGSRAAIISLAGTLALDPYRDLTKVTLEGAHIDGDAIERALKGISRTNNEQTALTATTSAPVKTHPLLPESIHLPKLPLVSLSARLKEIHYNKIHLSQIDTNVRTTSTSSITDSSINVLTKKSGTLSLHVDGDVNEMLRMRMRGKNINLLPLAAVVQKRGELLEGAVNNIDVDLAFSPKQPRTSLTGNARAKLSRCIVPSTLHDQVPFNILFLPFDALITVFGGTLNAMLPPSVSSISDSIRQVLDDAGRLGIENGEIDLTFDKGAITCRKFQIDTKNLPDFSIKGQVSPTNKLDFTIFIALLKLNLPLPVAGTLETPLPDLLYLGPEIIRGLGLSVGNIANGVMSLVGITKEEPIDPEGAE